MPRSIDAKSTYMDTWRPDTQRSPEPADAVFSNGMTPAEFFAKSQIESLYREAEQYERARRFARGRRYR